MQGKPVFKNSAELRHPTEETEPTQVSQVSGHQIPAMGHDSPAFQAGLITARYGNKSFTPIPVHYGQPVAFEVYNVLQPQLESFHSQKN